MRKKQKNNNNVKKLNKKLLISQNIKLLLIAFVSLLFLQCSKDNHRIKANDVILIKIAYLTKGINPNMAVRRCSDVLDFPPELLNDSVIKDSTFINTFVSIINKLQINNSRINYDFRIRCMIRFKDGTKKEICFGEDRLIVYEGILMKDSGDMFEFLNKNLYHKE